MRAPSIVLVNTGYGKGKSSAAFGVISGLLVYAGLLLLLQTFTPQERALLQGAMRFKLRSVGQ